MPRMPAARGYSAGFATVAPAPTPRIVQGPSVSRAVEGLGEAVRNIGADMIQTERRKTDEATDLAVREARQRDAEERQDTARRNRLDAGVKATVFELDAGDLKRELDQRLERGELDARQYESELQLKVDELRGKAQKSLAPDVELDFQAASATAWRKIQIDGRNTVRANGKRQAIAKLDEGREALTRLAVEDLPRALAAGAQLYAPDGPYSAQIGTDQAQKQGQAFRELATHAHFQRKVVESQNSWSGLGALEKSIAGNTDMEPRQQSGLLAAIATRRSALENRAAAAADRRDRQAERAWNEIQQIERDGVPIDPKWLAPKLTALKGTPLEAQATDLLRGVVESAGLGTKTLPEQDRAIQSLQADILANGNTPDRSRRLQKAVTIRDAQLADIRKDPWEASLRRMDIDAIPPIRTDSLEGLATSLAQRLELAPTIERRAGRAVSPLRPDEVEGVVGVLKALPIPQQSAWLGRMQSLVGPASMRAFAAQAKDKDNALGIAAALAAEDQSEAGRKVGQLYLAGRKAKTDKLVKVDERPEWGDEASIRKLVRGAFATPDAENDATEAALNVYLGMKAEGISPSYEAAVRATTGSITEHNGAKFVMPRGWDESRTKRAIGRIDQALIEQAAGTTEPLFLGGLRISAGNVAESIRQAKLRPYGNNRYRVQLGESFVTVDGNRPLIISLKEAAPAGSQPAARPVPEVRDVR